MPEYETISKRLETTGEFFKKTGEEGIRWYHHIGKFLLHMPKVIVRISPLEAFQELVCLNGDGLRKVRRRVELIPVPIL